MGGLGAQRPCPLGNRIEKTNGVLSQFLRTWRGTKTGQKARSSLDSRVNPSAP